MIRKGLKLEILSHFRTRELEQLVLFGFLERPFVRISPLTVMVDEGVLLFPKSVVLARISEALRDNGRGTIELEGWKPLPRQWAHLYRTEGTPTVSPENIPAVKQCAHCEQQKTRGEFNRNKRSPDGLHSWCRTCMKSAQRRNREKNRKHQRK